MPVLMLIACGSTFVTNHSNLPQMNYNFSIRVKLNTQLAKMCDSLIAYLQAHPEATDEAKQFMLDWMSSVPYTMVNPEEGITAIEHVQQSKFCESDLYKKWMKFRLDTFSQFWAEHVAPEMNKDSLVRFLELMGGLDLTEAFGPSCLAHLSRCEKQTN